MIRAFVYESNKILKEFSDLESLRPHCRKNMLWIDIEGIEGHELQFLKETFDFHPLSLEDSSGDISSPKVEHYPNYLFIVFHAIKFDADDEKLTTIEVDIFLGKNYVVTVHKSPVRSIAWNLEKCRRTPELTLGMGSDFLVHNILDGMVDHYGPVCEEMDDVIELLQDEVMVDPDVPELRSIFALKRSIMYLRRVMVPQRDTLNQMARGDYPLIERKNLVYFRDIYDHINRHYESTENMRELVSSTLELYVSSVANRTNDVMRVLTIVATIMLPLTLIASIYGMNFHFIPGAQDEYGFFWVLLGMALLGVIMFWIFKKKKWF